MLKLFAKYKNFILYGIYQKIYYIKIDEFNTYVNKDLEENQFSLDSVNSTFYSVDATELKQKLLEIDCKINGLQVLTHKFHDYLLLIGRNEVRLIYLNVLNNEIGYKIIETVRFCKNNYIFDIIINNEGFKIIFNDGNQIKLKIENEIKDQQKNNQFTNNGNQIKLKIENEIKDQQKNNQFTNNSIFSMWANEEICFAGSFNKIIMTDKNNKFIEYQMGNGRVFGVDFCYNFLITTSENRLLKIYYMNDNYEINLLTKIETKNNYIYLLKGVYEYENNVFYIHTLNKDGFYRIYSISGLKINNKKQENSEIGYKVTYEFNIGIENIYKFQLINLEGQTISLLSSKSENVFVIINKNNWLVYKNITDKEILKNNYLITNKNITDKEILKNNNLITNKNNWLIYKNIPYKIIKNNKKDKIIKIIEKEKSISLFTKENIYFVDKNNLIEKPELNLNSKEKINKNNLIHIPYFFRPVCQGIPEFCEFSSATSINENHRLIGNISGFLFITNFDHFTDQNNLKSPIIDFVKLEGKIVGITKFSKIKEGDLFLISTNVGCVYLILISYNSFLNKTLEKSGLNIFINKFTKFKYKILYQYKNCISLSNGSIVKITADFTYTTNVPDLPFIDGNILFNLRYKYINQIFYKVLQNSPTTVSSFLEIEGNLITDPVQDVRFTKMVETRNKVFGITDCHTFYEFNKSNLNQYNKIVLSCHTIVDVDYKEQENGEIESIFLLGRDKKVAVVNLNSLKINYIDCAVENCSNLIYINGFIEIYGETIQRIQYKE
ncbi:hypothetical protein NUSPORA_01736 [Nucleospora cyclopteri]